MGLYSAFGQNPISFTDPWGLFQYTNTGDPVIDDFMKVILANAVKEYETNERLQYWFENIQNTRGTTLHDFYQTGKGPEIVLVTDLGAGRLGTTPSSLYIKIDRNALRFIAEFWANIAPPSASVIWIEFWVRVLFHEAVHATSNAYKEQLLGSYMLETQWIMDYRLRWENNSVLDINPKSPVFDVLTMILKSLYEKEEGRMMEFFVWGERHIPKVERGKTPKGIKIPCPPKYSDITEETHQRRYPPTIKIEEEE